MQEIKLTEKDLKILEVIKSSPIGKTPTEIGMKLGKHYGQASSYCSSSLKKLMEAGMIVKIRLGNVRYKLKQSGNETKNTN